MIAKAAGFICGLIFGLGLTVSGMSNPAKVLNFLDVLGTWDPSLLVVMAAALIVTFVGYRLVWRRAAPVCAAEFQKPQATKVDRRLVSGSVMFGVGWGLVGLCPGPAITALIIGGEPALYFFLAMIVGMGLAEVLFLGPQVQPAGQHAKHRRHHK